jgi:DNA polymerase III subunit epsilon
VTVVSQDAAGPSLDEQRFAVVDVETSGLSPRRHRILQVAVVQARADGTILDEWASDVRPRLWRVGPTHVHGLTARQLRGAPTIAGLVPALIDRLDGAVLAAHNASFDWAFLRRSLRRAGYTPPDARRLCTLRLSRSLDDDGVESHRLVDLCDRYGIDHPNAHDALACPRHGHAAASSAARRRRDRSRLAQRRGARRQHVVARSWRHRSQLVAPDVARSALNSGVPARWPHHW